jgi:beta-lactamase superfamily II metal-dependent hydrolase
MKIKLDPEMTVTSMSMGGVVLKDKNPDTGENENDMSVSLLVEWGTFKYFIGGDIEHPTEEELAANDLILNVDVYHSTHHGSDTSSAADLMEDMQPTVIIISNGDHGGYQHPRQTTLDYYKDMSPKPSVFQTNKYFKGKKGGNVANKYIADPETSNDTGTILLSVDEPNGTYEVSYRDLSHEFQIKKEGN